MVVEHSKHHYIRKSEIKLLGQQLGCGRYGNVYTVKYKDTVCAAKEFHICQSIKQEERQKLKDKFIEKCCYFAKITHPNIVQCLGIYYPHQCSFPVIVMELMDVTLATYLEKSNTDLSKQASLLHDIATGLNFLHTRSPPIVHGDLSSDNILLKFSGEGLLPIAKIANLGVAKIVKTCTNAIARITEYQSSVFMAPEALIHPQKDSTSIDVFSIGCVSLHIFSHKLPMPMALTKRNGDKTNNQCNHVVYLNMITGEAAILKPMIEACLHEDPECRPSVTLLLENIKRLMVMFCSDFI